MMPFPSLSSVATLGTAEALGVTCFWLLTCAASYSQKDTRAELGSSNLLSVKKLVDALALLPWELWVMRCHPRHNI